MLEIAVPIVYQEPSSVAANVTQATAETVGVTAEPYELQLTTHETTGSTGAAVSRVIETVLETDTFQAASRTNT